MLENFKELSKGELKKRIFLKVPTTNNQLNQRELHLQCWNEADKKKILKNLKPRIEDYYS